MPKPLPKEFRDDLEIYDQNVLKFPVSAVVVGRESNQWTMEIQAQPEFSDKGEAALARDRAKVQERAITLMQNVVAELRQKNYRLVNDAEPVELKDETERMHSPTSNMIIPAGKTPAECAEDVTLAINTARAHMLANKPAPIEKIVGDVLQGHKDYTLGSDPTTDAAIAREIIEKVKSRKSGMVIS